MLKTLQMRRRLKTRTIGGREEDAREMEKE
jgi:hypothetical protein